MDEDYIEVPPVPWKDRSTGLVAFGVVQVCLGAFCALFAVLSFLGMAMMAAMPSKELAAAGVSPDSMLFPVLLYLVGAVWFISVGIGSVRKRRWARALILVWSCLCMVCGVVGTFFMVLFMGDMHNQMGASGQLPPGFANVIKVVTLGMTLFMYIFVPGSFLLFYRMESVRKTCEWRNPEPSWTDACPLPVLAHAMLFTVFPVFALLMGSYDWATPLFGRVVTGAPGALLLLAMAGLFGLLAYGACRLKPAAWWGSIALVAFWGASATITFFNVSLMEYYELAGMNEQQLDLMRPIVESGNYSRLMRMSGVLWAGILLSLIVFTRRYYPKSELTATAP